MTYFGSYGVVFAVVLAGALLVAVAFLAAHLIAPNRPRPEKLLTYECGIDPVGHGPCISRTAPPTGSLRGEQPECDPHM